MLIKKTIRGIHGHEADKSESIKNYMEEHSAKLQNLLEKEQQPIDVEMIATVITPHPNHEFEVHIKGPRFHVIVQRKGPELYKIIDEGLDIAFQEVVKHKDKIVDNKRREGGHKRE